MFAHLPPPRRSYDTALSALFCLAVALPALWLAASAIGDWRHSLAQLASSAILDDAPNLARRFEASFPFRKPFWRSHNAIRRVAFRVHPASVVSGQSGWWFYRSEAAEDGPSLNDRAGRVVPSAAEVEGWRRILERRRAWLAAMNVVYMPLIAPNKHTIYPDHLPVALLREHGETRLDRVMSALGPWPAGLLDLRPALVEARSRGDVYLRTDTHWNDEGAYAAYFAIVAAIRSRLPEMRALPRECFVASTESVTGDIVAMAQLRISEQTVRLRPDPARCSEARAQARRDGPRILFIGDSFAAGLVPFLAESAREIVMAERIFRESDVAAARPDVVIHELAERHLDVMFAEAPSGPLRLSR